MSEPTFQDVAYGDHDRDVVDLYQADSKIAWGRTGIHSWRSLQAMKKA